MIPGAKRKRIRIHITTYLSGHYHQAHKMEDKANKKCCNVNHDKYVCSICLNQKAEDKNCDCCKKIPINCPICQKNKDWSGKYKERERTGAEKDTVYMSPTTDSRGKGSPTTIRDISTDCSGKVKERVEAERQQTVLRDPNVKIVQTSDSSVVQGLTLLNEVLTVFQNKKVDINKEKVKSGLVKDVAVSTVDEIDEKTPKDKPRLTVSTFQYSIDDRKSVSETGKFTVVNCTQPIYLRNNNFIELPKHKSSSIPQMKLEELKYSLKEKSRSKDAIEEVNRMFATVRKASRNLENPNRPMVRNGPRVLPLVITNYPETMNYNCSTNNTDMHSSCKCCQTCLSSGDSFTKSDCNHGEYKEKCDKCTYMMCCHFENLHKKQAERRLMCEHCRDLKTGQRTCEELCFRNTAEDF